nr:unnamed protein product [Digitaria exilis]
MQPYHLEYLNDDFFGSLCSFLPPRDPWKNRQCIAVARTRTACEPVQRHGRIESPGASSCACVRRRLLSGVSLSARKAPGGSDCVAARCLACTALGAPAEGKPLARASGCRIGGLRARHPSLWSFGASEWFQDASALRATAAALGAEGIDSKRGHR